MYTPWVSFEIYMSDLLCVALTRNVIYVLVQKQNPGNRVRDSKFVAHRYKSEEQYIYIYTLKKGVVW